MFSKNSVNKSPNSTQSSFSRPNLKDLPRLRGFYPAMTLGCGFLLVGCTTTSHYQHPDATNRLDGEDIGVSTEQQGQAAKAELSKTLSAMLRRSFAYDTRITISNGNRRSALQQATPEQLNHANDRDTHCEEVHDSQYVKILADYQNEGGDIEDINNSTAYAPKLDALKEQYIGCYAAYMTWSLAKEKREMQEFQNWYDDDDDDDSDDSDDSDDNDVSEDIFKAVADDQQNASEAVIDVAKDWRNDDSSADDDAVANDCFIDIEEPIFDASGQVIGHALVITDEPCTSIDLLDSEDKDASAPDAYDDRQKIELPAFMVGNDYSHTQADVKQASLWDAYLWQRASAQISGIYRPLSGKFTLLPQLSYHGQNLLFSVNQPIIIDIRNQSIYLWADTLVLPVSEYFDDKLGLSWRNKWLKISIDDDSLPAGFANDLLHAHLNAAQAVLQQEQDSHFAYRTFNSDSALASQQLFSLDSLQPLSLSTIPNTHHVIEHQQNSEDIERAREVYFKFIYDSITTKYPEFLTLSSDESDDKSDDVADALDYQESDAIIDHEDAHEDDYEDAHTDASNSNDDHHHDYSGADTTSENSSLADKFNAKMVATAYLKLLKSFAHIKDADIDSQDDDHDHNHDYDYDHNHNYHNNDDDQDYIDTATKAINQYGFDGAGHLKWWRYQFRMASTDQYQHHIDNGEGEVVTVHTTFSPINPLTKQTLAFPNLPANVQTPNATNTINIVDYLDQLKQRYEQGGGSAFGRLLLDYDY